LKEFANFEHADFIVTSFVTGKCFGVNLTGCFEKTSKIVLSQAVFGLIFQVSGGFQYATSGSKSPLLFLKRVVNRIK
jgi:hypothetical protein